MAAAVILKAGEEPSLLSADFANKHLMIPVHALRNLTVTPMGVGKLVMQGEKAVLQLDPTAIAAAAIVPLAPWKSAALAVSIRYGVINDNAGPHELSSYGPVAITATRFFFAKVTTDADGLITALDLHHQSTVTPPAFSDTVSYKYLGRAVVAGGVMAAPEPQITGSQNYRRVGYTDNYTHLYETA